MGAEFLKRTRNSNVKCIDRGRVELAERDLFTQTPTSQSRSVVAKLEKGSKLDSGACVIIETNGDGLMATIGHSVVAKARNPPADVVASVGKGGGIAKGVVGKLNRISNTVEITVC